MTGKQLVCHLYDYDQFIKTDKVGVVQLRLSTIPNNELMSVQKAIDRVIDDGHHHDDVSITTNGTGLTGEVMA